MGREWCKRGWDGLAEKCTTQCCTAVSSTASAVATSTEVVTAQGSEIPSHRVCLPECRVAPTPASQMHRRPVTSNTPLERPAHCYATGPLLRNLGNLLRNRPR